MENKIINEDVVDVISEVGKKIFEFEGKNILITGASGMLASYLVYVLIYANKNLFKNPCNLYLLVREESKKFSDTDFVHYIYGDVSTIDSRKIKVKFNYIVHAASKAAPKIYLENMLDTLNTNIKGLYNVLDLATEETKSVLYFSSGEVYGQVDTNGFVNEKYIGKVDHLGKRSCYAEGKRAGETICMNYFWEKKCPVKIARIFHTFGPGLNLNDGRVFSDFIRMGLDGKDIEIIGNKTFERPFLYIKDATVMFLLLLLSDKNGEVYNVSNNREIYQIGELAKLVAEIINKRKDSKIKIIEKISNEDYLKTAQKSTKPDITKFINEFKYIPKTTLEEALERTIMSLLP